jgi:dTMP kinase
MEHKAQIIVIDGADSTGKATQVALLKERLEAEGVAVAHVDFPRYEDNTFGSLLRECLDGKHGDFMSLDPKVAAALYAADRFESKEQLQQWLSEGKVVLFDRYVSANMMHQGAKIEDVTERAEFLKWLEHVEHEVFGIPRPDITIHLNVPPEKTQQLLEYMVSIGQKTADVAEADREHQQKVAACAQEIVQDCDGWESIECMDGDQLRSREDIHEEIYGIVSKYL